MQHYSVRKVLGAVSVHEKSQRTTSVSFWAAQSVKIDLVITKTAQTQRIHTASHL